MIRVFPGVKNILNLPLKNEYKADVMFEELKPSVKFTGKGIIMPSSDKLIIPFEAVSLKAVDVTVIRIYENNVAQFLQVNNLQGHYEMTRVGRPVVKKTIKLDVDRLVDLHKPNQFGINLEEFVNAEPGAIYNVKFSFKPGYSLYRCQNDTTNMFGKEDSEGSTLQSLEEEYDDAAQNQYEYEDQYYDDD